MAAIVCGSIICRSDKAIRELDYRPASLETMFRDCIDWMIAEDLIRPSGGSPLGHVFLGCGARPTGNRKTG